MSERACSAAWRVFFEGDLVTLVEAPDRGYADLHLPFAAQQRADLVQRQIRLLGYDVEQPPLVVLERRATVTCSRFGLNTAGRRPNQPKLLSSDNCRFDSTLLTR
jgi:hypothetical protein